MMFNRYMSTADLINEYDSATVARFDKCQLGSSRFVSRQAKVNEIVDELERRADAGDELAEAWFTA